MLGASFIGRIPIQRLMNTVMVVVLYKGVEFSIKILSIPKEEKVKVFPSVPTSVRHFLPLILV